MDEIIFGDTILTTKPILREQRVIDVATKLAEVSSRLEKDKELYGYYKEILAAEFPEQPDEHMIELEDGRVVVVTIPEKWEWDKAQLKSLYSHNSTPDCVTENFTIVRTKFLAAPDDIQTALKKALTIKCGPPTIKVQK